MAPEAPSLRSLLGLIGEDDSAARLAGEGGHAFVSASLRPYLIAALADVDEASRARPTLVVVGDDRAARDLAADLRAWLAPRRVRYYPSRGVAYESHLTPPPHLVGLRVAALDAVLAARDTADADQPVVVVSAVALSEKVPDPELRPRSFTLRVGELLDLEECASELVGAGYERVDQVEERGQFAMRGGLLDVFPATEERAVRVDMFDVEIESLRWFSTFTQRSLGDVEEVEIAPAAELAAEHRERAEIAAATGSFGPAGNEDPSGRPDIAELLPVERFRALLDLIGSEAELVVAAEEELAPVLSDHWTDVCAAFGDEDAHHLYVRPERVRRALSERARIWLSAIASGQQIELRAQSADTAARSLGEAEPELEKLVRSGYRTVVTFPRRGEGERAAYNLGRLKATWLGEEVDVARPALEPSLWFAAASLREGFVAPGLKLAVLPEHRLLRRRRAERPGGPGDGGAGRRRGALRSFTELRTGDIVVHEDHGVARFAGFETRTVADVTRDYLYLEYQGDDRVFVPTDQLAKISRYVGAAGAGGGHPPLSKLGGTRWETMKARARRAAQELAGELLSLYSERRRRSGHAFGADSDWQRDFEERFPFTETPDQREAIELVKADMEAPRPMDRLICGDVGYGKTEVALRAAFKAANEGKQVLMLVPTTILAQQHYGTFAERLGDYPFTLEHVSRFRSQAEQQAAVRGFAEGRVDILIGTHRVLSRDVRAKDLGLLIVDEEQRFGVKQKELLRQLKLKVDVISMSATPIPRTLQMSLAGLRDISVIETPPEGRRPVRTYVGEYEEELVRRAIMREHERGGQAFFLHNRIESIDETAERLRALCPGVRFAVAHGQMGEGELEGVMMDYLRGGAEVLVCTSIIESGIDIPQANTLIVEHADTFGLSQLYQIRGRVGRSRERAYAYLLVRLLGGAHVRGGAAPVGAVGLHRAGSRLQHRDARFGDPRRGQSARGRAVRARGGAGIRALHADARRGGPRGRAPPGGRGALRAGAPGRERRRVRAGRLCPLRAGKDRRAPPCRGGARGGRRGDAPRRARGPLRSGSRAAREPARAAAGTHQVRPGGRADGELQGGPSGGCSDRAGLGAREAPARGVAGRDVRVGTLAGLGASSEGWKGAFSGRGEGGGRAAGGDARGGLRNPLSTR